uniref:Macro domain-containing protein n=1 Tax=Haptolina ericina TaxID=156174 RepID=A0A7S3B3J4_9EUKA
MIDSDLSRPTRSVSALFENVVLKPFGVLGTQLTLAHGVVQQAPPPMSSEAFIDPAGLHYIQAHGPAGAGGASGAIYSHIGISGDASFPQLVRDGVQAAGDACLHAYSVGGVEHYVIHTVGPDLRVGDPTWKQAVRVLSRAYYNVLSEFHRERAKRDASAPQLTTLRLLPISGGIFAGAYQDQIAPLTMAALANGYRMLGAAEQKQLLGEAIQLHLCIFLEKEMSAFEAALANMCGVLLHGKRGA